MTRMIRARRCFGGFLSEVATGQFPYVPSVSSTVVTGTGQVASNVLWNKAMTHAASRGLTYPMKSSIFRRLLGASNKALSAAFFANLAYDEGNALYHEVQASRRGECQ